MNLTELKQLKDEADFLMSLKDFHANLVVEPRAAKSCWLSSHNSYGGKIPDVNFLTSSNFGANIIAAIELEIDRLTKSLAESGVVA